MLQAAILILLGAASVAQGGLNRQFIGAIGLPKVVLLNNFVLLLASVVFFLLYPAQTSGASRPIPFALLIVPGVLGLSLVAGIPWAISKWGASFVFIGLIGTQVVCSLLWDSSLEGGSFGLRRALSILLALGSVFLMLGADK